MEHAEALERIEIAAAEPDGLDRLMAGDTPDASAIAGHLAGCPSCVAELARIRRTASIAREVIQSQPNPELRARTLADVRAAGVPRGQGAAPVPATAEPPIAPAIAPAIEVETGRTAEAVPAPARLEEARSRRPSRLAWLVAVAAVVALAIGIGFVTGIRSGASETAAKDREIAILGETAAATLRIQSQPDARQIALVATPEGGGATGTLLFSPSTGELVAVATDLAQPTAAQVYGCWVEVGGVRRRIGRMYPAGGLWSWAGPAAGLNELPPGAVFGVSLGPPGGGVDNVPVLTGEL